MNVHARARASAQAIDRSATRLDPVAGLDDLLRRRRRQPLRRVAAVALTLLVVAVAIWAGAGLRRPTPQPTLGPVTRFRVGPAPVSVAVTPGVAWVLNTGNSTISRIDPETGRVQSSFTASFVVDVDGRLVFATVAEGRLWVVHNVGYDETAVTAVDPSTGRALPTIRFGGFVIDALGKQGDLAIGSGAVWVALEGEDHVKRFDGTTGKLLDQYPLDEPTALAVDGQALWVATGDGRLHRINIATGAETARATRELVTRILVGQSGMWLLTADGKVLRADRRTGRIVAKVPGTFQAADLAVGAEGVWIYEQHQGAVLRIDPGTNRIARTIPVISQPLVELYSRVLALGDGAVWVVDKAGEAVVRIDPNR